VFGDLCSADLLLPQKWLHSETWLASCTHIVIIQHSICKHCRILSW